MKFSQDFTGVYIINRFKATNSIEVDAHQEVLPRGMKQTLQAIRECTEGSLFSCSVFMREHVTRTM